MIALLFVAFSDVTVPPSHPRLRSVGRLPRALVFVAFSDRKMTRFEIHFSDRLVLLFGNDLCGLGADAYYLFFPDVFQLLN
jgi:hypothetical protein